VVQLELGNHDSTAKGIVYQGHTHYQQKIVLQQQKKKNRQLNNQNRKLDLGDCESTQGAERSRTQTIPDKIMRTNKQPTTPTHKQTNKLTIRNRQTTNQPTIQCR
jgi:hypothetical protein